MYQRGTATYNQWWSNFTKYVDEEFAKLMSLKKGQLYSRTELWLFRKNMLQSYNGRIANTLDLEFDTEEDAVFFILRFS